MIRCCNVNEYGSFNKVGTVLEKKIDQLNDAGCKILNVFETRVTKVPNCSDQGFIIIYDDGEKMKMPERANDCPLIEKIDKSIEDIENLFEESLSESPCSEMEFRCGLTRAIEILEKNGVYERNFDELLQWKMKQLKESKDKEQQNE